MLIVAALYHFTRLPDPAALRGPLLRLASAQGVRGTLLLAPEGINGTIAGTRGAIDEMLAHIRALPGCATLEWKESGADTMPFGRMKVRLKREIVTMGQPDVDPTAATGHYVEPGDWNDLIRAGDVAVIDTRNDYEVAIGTFDGAVNPQTRSFREFPDWWRENAHRFHNKRIAMFCTGGIRCEKSTNYLLSQGVDQVYHLRGGILKYLETVAPDDSTWQGACFVFDERVSLTHGLHPGGHSLCRACRRPLTPADLGRPDYEPGVSCHHCRGEYSDADRARFRERQHQVDLAAARGQAHIGADHGDQKGTAPAIPHPPSPLQAGGDTDG
ncbi:MAG: rhodanese-related sulfurtransferase [Paracoccus sp. (in: a-proteobacteria)]|nr:rhodanese-related sulfurtransferase [Paracoccus sp. (in: a-proteobacteria)]